MSDQEQAMRRYWQERAAREQRQEQERRRDALHKARRAAAHIKSRYPGTTVYLYGSLAWGQHFTPHSDIDLLVTGLPAGANYWQLLVELEPITLPWPVSLVDAADALPQLRDKVLREGVIL
ncbi:MAG: nucleotidyltransferase family protein [Bacillota bacterium]|uniref:nucleotidyltransferase family protein n=1 Tax=Desulfurispora thermophila TaxID=265470 RepID=UPI000365D8C1|nr:nucleotidyltransferase domain-containing protein [Desulfurispora thermophila]